MFPVLWLIKKIWCLIKDKKSNEGSMGVSACQKNVLNYVLLKKTHRRNNILK